VRNQRMYVLMVGARAVHRHQHVLHNVVLDRAVQVDGGRDDLPSMVASARCAAEELLFNAAFWTCVLASCLPSPSTMTFPWLGECLCCTIAASRAAAVPAYSLRTMVTNSCGRQASE
jgi:hypothetical protein